MRKIFFILSILTFCGQAGRAQSEEIKKILTGNRWALNLLIERYDDRLDTLLRVHDCSEEYFEFYADGKFSSGYTDRDGKWSVSADSILNLRLHNGKRLKAAFVYYASADSLILYDREGKSSFTETYGICRNDDSTMRFDSREIYTVRAGWGLSVGAMHADHTFADIGLTTARFAWDDVFYGFSVNAELAPQNKFYGIGMRAWSENRLFAYGLGTYVHTDFSTLYPSLRPEIGLSANRLLSKYNMTAHLMYGYNLALGSRRSEYQNLHQIAFRFYFPIRRWSYKLRKKINPQTTAGGF